ncbi:hypothetical protein G6F35_016094 [Rhizopus arrhizus]|nr:hypothetical protein G6F35_016094 [Rhizopus arrhizus]
MLGNAWNDLVQPFWILPALALSKLKLRDVMGYTVIMMLWVGVIHITATGTDMSKPTAYLVTGGSAGIGAAIIRMLLEAGHKVVNIDYRLPENPPAGLVSYQADLTDEARTKEVAGEVTAAYNIVGLVNNAGATRPGTADTATLADLDYVPASAAS